MNIVIEYGSRFCFRIMIVPPLHRSRSPEVCGDGAMATYGDGSMASDEASEFLRQVVDENRRLKAANHKLTEKNSVFEAALVDADWADEGAVAEPAVAEPADTVAPEPAAPAARMEEAAEGLRVRLCLSRFSLSLSALVSVSVLQSQCFSLSISASVSVSVCVYVSQVRFSREKEFAKLVGFADLEDGIAACDECEYPIWCPSRKEFVLVSPVCFVLY